MYYKKCKDVIPEEAWSKKKPDVSHLKVFGCIAYAHVPDHKLKKLDDNEEVGIFIGLSNLSKAYKLYNPKTKKTYYQSRCVC